MSLPPEDEAALLREALAGVKPLDAVARADTPTGVARTLGHERRRETAVQDASQDSNPLSTEIPQRYGPHDPLEFRRDGVQYGVFRKLKRGAYEAESRLDLHRLFVEQAREAVFNFVNECHAHGLRTVIILHGKGERSATPARLKNGVALWLPQLEAVQAFCSAQPQHGGTGAVYVLLRKSERSRERNAAQYRR